MLRCIWYSPTWRTARFPDPRRYSMATVAPDPLEDLTSQGVLDGLYEVIDDRVVAKAMGAYEYWPRESFSGCSTATPTRTRSVGPSSRWSSTSDLKSSASGGRTWLRLLRTVGERSPHHSGEVLGRHPGPGGRDHQPHEYGRRGRREAGGVFPGRSPSGVGRLSSPIQGLCLSLDDCGPGPRAGGRAGRRRLTPGFPPVRERGIREGRRASLSIGDSRQMQPHLRTRWARSGPRSPRAG